MRKEYSSPIVELEKFTLADIRTGLVSSLTEGTDYDEGDEFEGDF